jgi:hypothetical protein
MVSLLAVPALAADTDRLCEEKYQAALRTCNEPVPESHHRSVGITKPEEMRENERQIQMTCRIVNEGAIASCKREAKANR